MVDRITGDVQDSVNSGNNEVESLQSVSSKGDGHGDEGEHVYSSYQSTPTCPEDKIGHATAIEGRVFLGSVYLLRIGQRPLVTSYQV